MLPPVYPLLMASTAVQALIADRAYRHGSAPQGVARPYVTWSVPGGFAENAFDGASADVFRLQVDCWADTDDTIEALASAVRAAIEPAAHLVAYTADERNFETRRYRIGMAFDFILAR
jgi:Ni,Fe-hydrogenase I large subunit